MNWYWWLLLFVANWLYIIHVKDVYYAYGQIVTLKYDSDATITYNQYGGVSVHKLCGSNIYTGHLGKSVLKLLRKNEIITDADYRSRP